ncbi:hypothetical protein [Streptomyces sp. NPDC001020]
MTWPRQDDEDVVALRALAWARCRDHLPGRPEHQPLDEAERGRLLDAFAASRTDAAQETDSVRSLADLFLDFGENYLSRGPLCWSPARPPASWRTGCPARPYSIRSTACSCPPC